MVLIILDVEAALLKLQFSPLRLFWLQFLLVDTYLRVTFYPLINARFEPVAAG